MTTVDDLRFCRDCAHSRKEWTFEGAHAPCCAHPALGVDYDIVTGDAVPVRCVTVRQREDRCGRDGAWWTRRTFWWCRLTERLKW